MGKRIEARDRLSSALIETASDMRQAGILSRDAHDKITMRLVGEAAPPLAAPVTSEDIRAMRERANMSQAVFARCLNVTVSYVSQLERGTKRPSGAALALFNMIRRNGVEAIL
ncbi:MAG: helix-turn-helix domain-containing protein [Roseiarcus sp.]